MDNLNEEQSRYQPGKKFFFDSRMTQSLLPKSTQSFQTLPTIKPAVNQMSQAEPTPTGAELFYYDLIANNRRSTREGNEFATI